MDILIKLLMSLEAIVCLLLIGIVLLQRSKGEGLGLSFGGGAEAVFGAQVGNVLTRGTVILAIIFMANTTILSVITKGGGSGKSTLSRMAEKQEAAKAASEQTAAMPDVDMSALDDQISHALSDTAATATEAAPASDGAEAAPSADTAPAVPAADNAEAASAAPEVKPEAEETPPAELPADEAK